MDGPDRGWAWAVAFAVGAINFIMAGLGRMSGILYVAFIDIYGVDRKGASTPFSVRSSTRNLLGPVVGILGQKYGIQVVIISGAVMSTISAALCFFADDIGWITLLWGGLGGYFRDTLGTYDYILYINGSVGIVIGLIWILEPFLLRLFPAAGGDLS